MLTLLTIFPLACFGTESGEAPEWGAFRGNNGAGHATSESIPDSLDPETNRLWRTELPAGYSSPIVAGDNIFVTGAEEKKLSTFCISRSTGEIRWRGDVEFDGKRPGASSSAAPTPVTDGELVYVVFHHAGLIAYDYAGEQKWRQELGEIKIPHGLSASPVIVGDKVIQLVDQDGGSFLAAYDKKTGKKVWRTERDALHSYTSPAFYQPKEGLAQIVVSGAFEISSYSVVDGSRLWWVKGACWNPKGVPVIDGDRCFVSSYVPSSAEWGLPSFAQTFEEALADKDANEDGLIESSEFPSEMLGRAWFVFDLNDDGFFDAEDWAYCQSTATATGGLFAIDMTGKGDVTETHVKWKNDGRKGLPGIPTPLALDGLLYTVRQGGVFTVFDADSSEIIKSGRVGEPDTFYASPIHAAGKIITASQSGIMSIIRAGREWEELSVTDLGEEIWSTPAIAGDQVFVRSLSALHCFKGKAEGE